MGIPLRQGRDISEGDAPTSEPVIMVNETMARDVVAGRGSDREDRAQRLCPERRVIGVVGDVRHLALEQSAGNEMYLPARQCRDQASTDLVIRSSLSLAPLAGAVRTALRPLAPDLAGNDFRTLQQLVDRSVSPRRFLVLLLGGFAAFALVLASLGIYGLVSYSVTQRTQEIGIRMAVGASAREVQTGIIVQTLWLAAIGISIGAAASWALAQGLSGLLVRSHSRGSLDVRCDAPGPDQRGGRRRLSAGTTSLAY